MIVQCEEWCGQQELTEEQTDKQLRREDQQFRCPSCGGLAKSENQLLGE